MKAGVKKRDPRFFLTTRETYNALPESEKVVYRSWFDEPWSFAMRYCGTNVLGGIRKLEFLEHARDETLELTRRLGY